MEKNYTEKELKDWFEMMIKKYPNSVLEQHLTSVRECMLGKWSNDALNEVYKKD